MLSTEYASNVAFRDMGINSMSIGGLVHAMQPWFISFFPISMFYDKNGMKDYLAEERAE